jgi:hypothetical protein
MNADIIQLTGSTLVCVPGKRISFALSHSNRSVIDKFELRPILQTSQAFLGMLMDILGSRAGLLRYIVCADMHALPGDRDRAERTKDCKAALASLGMAGGIELRSIP